MKATIDAAGRIVVPKPLRQSLGLKPRQPLEIRAGDGHLEIEIAPTPMQLQTIRVKLSFVKKVGVPFQSGLAGDERRADGRAARGLGYLAISDWLLA